MISDNLLIDRLHGEIPSSRKTLIVIPEEFCCRPSANDWRIMLRRNSRADFGSRFQVDGGQET